MSKKIEEQEAMVTASINSIYQRLLAQKEQQRAEFEARKAEEERIAEEEKAKSKEEKKKAKLEKQEGWKTIIEEMTGQDLDYLGKKVKDRKYSYKQWYDIETDKTELPKKKKKHNYRKEFEQELKMLRTAVSEQNKFTADLHKRFQNALGPANKDAAIPSKTMVELAGAINAGRSNSLGMIREIALIKKTIAELRMKQQKSDAEAAGNQYQTAENTDLGLMGSSVLGSFFDNNFVYQSDTTQTPNQQPDVSQQSLNIEKFDPSSWEGPQLTNDFTKYENVPHDIIVEMNDQSGSRRFLAVERSTGNELVGCNIPSSDPNTLKYDQKNDCILGVFGESYKVKHV